MTTSAFRGAAGRAAPVALAAALAAAAAAPASAFTVYTDRSAWEAAVAAYAVTDDSFDADVASAKSIVFDSGVVSSYTLGAEFSTINQISGGAFSSNVDPDGSGGTIDLSWLFPTAIIGFGIDIQGGAGAEGTGSGVQLQGDYDGAGLEIVDIFTVLGPESDGFVGILGEAAFTVVGLVARPNDLDANKAYSVTDLSFASAAPVPLPAGAALLTGGVAAFGLLRRRRRG
ncbi:VPLPA-CTERM sorting domain-containing protein [Albimonas pacifica]|uniref:VPLPA-CTERM protein sorting domain-containing protein n=1 Tax=Albimonas pacifica TaxID=1114924 RepID=A0A1I3DDD0_9RHOB|nr:VPLPA-CTERM sorting domain-containing protein [Albimonas pacifica]SFH84717.1 VPLPA-CTERM protein sorting domain-containing protein [Albimonas pacifica]